jgi:IS30 family transposase
MGYKHFSKYMRRELSILREKGYSTREIAKVLKINQSSVVRELRRNRNVRNNQYDSGLANHKARTRRRLSKFEGMKLRSIEGLEEYVIQKLQEGWTPEQIAGRLKAEQDKTIISFNGIYKWLYSAFGLPYIRYLTYRKMYRKKRKGKKEKRALIPNRVWIEERPKEADGRERIGDFEGDTLGKPKHSPKTFVGIVDRKSRFLLGRKVSRLKHSMEEGFQSILPDNAHTITLDNGPENVRHESLGIPTYFCHPYHSWEKPTIENTFQRLRRWIPKKARLENYSDEQIEAIIERMNNTPRKCLKFRTPAEVFKEH